MSDITVPYTRTEGHVVVYSQEDEKEFFCMYDLMDDANEKLIDHIRICCSKERKILKLEEKIKQLTLKIIRD